MVINLLMVTDKRIFQSILLINDIVTGIEGAAANAQVKQLEQQNSRLKEAILR